MSNQPAFRPREEPFDTSRYTKRKRNPEEDRHNFLLTTFELARRFACSMAWICMVIHVLALLGIPIVFFSDSLENILWCLAIAGVAMESFVVSAALSAVCHLVILHDQAFAKRQQ